MPFDPTTLDEADHALRAGDIDRFMRVIDRLARAVADGVSTWDDLGEWARERVDALLAVESALGSWETEMGSLFYNGSGEETTQAALRRRSQHAFARALFAGTAADDLLAGYEAADVDEEFRLEADRIGLSPPGHIPASHTWWQRSG